MIFHNRFQQPNIPIYQPNSTGETAALVERKKAVEFFQDPAPKKKPFGFKVYKDKLLAQELNKVFNEKCAYCDASYKANTPDDIEHFRPKSAINTFSGFKDDKAPIKPGYYWLAADWDNLLISCPRCNRAEKYKLNHNIELLGKKDRFPVANENYRAKKPEDNLSDEGALLLYPCLDKPEDYLTYVIEEVEGEIGLVKARNDIAPEHKIRAEASWIVYALNRPPLVADRRRYVMDLKRDFNQLITASWIYVQKKNIAGAETTIERNNFELTIERLNEAYKKTAPFLAIKRQMFQEVLQWETVKELKEKLNIDLAELLSIAE